MVIAWDMIKDVYEFQVVVKGAVNIRDVTTLGKHDTYAYIQYENYSYKLSTHHSYSTSPSKPFHNVVMI